MKRTSTAIQLRLPTISNVVPLVKGVSADALMSDLPQQAALYPELRYMGPN
jgi:hypothetical protein